MNFDNQHVWHPYAKIPNDVPTYLVESANGVYLNLKDNRRVIDGMSSWWSVIHGYNNPILNQSMKDQIDRVSHVMFGGLTNQPAIEICKKLIEITPANLDKVFLADSGSVSVEVSLKMALQYWYNKGFRDKTRFVTPKGGYHGDTFGAMAVCDPENGMHHLFSDVLPQHFFSNRPAIGNTSEALLDLEKILKKNHQRIAAMILEPIVQGAGGMNIYEPEYLKGARKLCDNHNVLLIVDEIATGFGRTGKLFGCEHAGVSPDILCLGKSLTGGYMTMSAVLTTAEVAENVGVLMHGPTFMGNPLSSSVANASIDLLLSSDWQTKVIEIEKILEKELLPLKSKETISDVRVIGAIGIVEFKQPLDIHSTQERLIGEGVWLRPYGKLLYTMPPFIISEDELKRITRAMSYI
ncbi:MAG: adenosylmethionine--8-amino-7-oxononanoate transaminase [Gammaproteobacteria bacterium]|nr:adenosylmethionine--8-amino-7-oxononanoate transaminase [Gammaproteobacteria bacterium]MDP6974258.1 adenosylmethionine--8-amino-7-oxononanoate transaminase [Gammaproteobacteria bacterium]